MSYYFLKSNDMYKKLDKIEGAVNEHRVYLIKEVLTKMKKKIKMYQEIMHLQFERMNRS